MQPLILFEVNPASGMPVFQQLINQVQRLIVSRQLVDGEILPSTREVARQLVINPMTVSKAYNQLERNGFITRKKGVGMLVNGPKRSAASEKSRLINPVLQELLSQAKQLEMSRDDVTILWHNLWRESDE